LLDEILGVEGPSENESEGLPGENEVLLDGQNLRLRGVVNAREKAWLLRLDEPERRARSVSGR
jgi:hypothetical protein